MEESSKQYKYKCSKHQNDDYFDDWDQNKCKNKCKNTYDYVLAGCGTSGSVLASILSANGKYSVLVIEQGVNNDNDPNILETQPRSQVLGINRDAKYSSAPVALLPVPTIFHDNLDVDPGRGPGLNGNFEAAGVGRGLGGSTIHYHLFAVRGSGDIYDKWAELSGDERWRYQNMIPYMKAIERFVARGISPDINQRGFAGPLTITQAVEPEWVTSFPIAKGIDNAGTKFIPDFNVSPQGDVGYSSNQEFKTEDSCATRTFASQAFLPPSVVTPDGHGVNGRKLRIYTKAKATRVIFNGITAIGLEFTRNTDNFKTEQKCEVAYARCKVIICNGAIETPALLQRSGVGPVATLQGQGFFVPLVVNSPHVGFHLKNHNGILTGLDTSDLSVFNGRYDPRNALPSTCTSPTINMGHDLRIQAYFDSTGVGEGFLPKDLYPIGTRQIQLFTNHGPNLTSRLVSQNDELFRLVGSPGNLVQTMQMENMRPKTEGVVFIADTDPLNFPRVDFNYYGDYIPTGTTPAYAVPGTDAYTTVQMIKMAKKIALNIIQGKDLLVFPPPSHFQTEFLPNGQPNPNGFPGGTQTNDARLFRDAQDSATPAHHYTGTARMARRIGTSAVSPGTNPARQDDDGDNGGVVDGRLHVFGTKNLMCVSNAIAPEIATANTALQAFYIGAVAASILIGKEETLNAINML